MAIGTGRGWFIPKRRRLSVKRIAIGRSLFFMTVAAFFDHLQRKITRRRQSLVMRNRRVTVDTNRGLVVAGLKGHSVRAMLVIGNDPRVTFDTDFR